MPMLREFPSAARISKFVAELEELMGRMNTTTLQLSLPSFAMHNLPFKTMFIHVHVVFHFFF